MQNCSFSEVGTWTIRWTLFFEEKVQQKRPQLAVFKHYALLQNCVKVTVFHRLEDRLMTKLLDFFVPHNEISFVGLNVGLGPQVKKSNKTGFYSLFISVLRSSPKSLMSYFYIKFLGR